MVEPPGNDSFQHHTDYMEPSPADEMNGDVDVGTEEQNAETPTPVMDPTQRLQSALMKRDNGKNPAHKCGATPKPAPKPKAKVKVLKKPSAKKATAKKDNGKPKPKAHDKSAKKVRVLKMTAQCVYSRAYHAAHSTLEKKSCVYVFPYIFSIFIASLRSTTKNTWLVSKHWMNFIFQVQSQCKASSRR